MTNTEKLKWLALNVSEFPRYAIYATTDGVVASYTFSLSSKSDDWFTMEEWQQERRKMQNKPSWSDAPSWAEFLAQSPTGSWEWYSGKPIAGASFWMHVDAEIYGETENHGGKVLGDWRCTLEARPEVIVSNQTSATITAINAVGGEMTITAQDNSWHERGEFPPAGCECLVKTSMDNWVKAFTVGLDIDGGMVVQFMEFDIPFNSCLDPSYFRPLRTERGKAIDEMVKAITDDRIAPLYVQNMAAKLYDAGYRKEQAK